MHATFRYVVLTAVRDRFPYAVIVALLAMTAVSLLIAVSTISEGQQMGLAYAGELFRTTLVFGLIIAVCFHVRRLHETREIEAILTRPISRAAFAVAYYAAFAAIAAVLAVITAPLLVVALHAHGLGLLDWEIGMILESWIVVALALFCAMALESATTAVLVSLGFYMLSRTAEFFLAIARSGYGHADSAGVGIWAEGVMDVVAAIVPRMDLFGQSSWLTYGPDNSSWGPALLVLQAAIYIPLLLAATIRDLRTRTF